ncbi:MAG: hypothetical protein R6W73_08730 [Candidatus Saliniplasma sp.]
MFSSVVNNIVGGLQEWAEGIQTQMTNFFEELAKWDTLDGDGSVDATMNVGTGLMLSSTKRIRRKMSRIYSAR